MADEPQSLIEAIIDMTSAIQSLQGSTEEVTSAIEGEANERKKATQLAKQEATEKKKALDRERELNKARDGIKESFGKVKDSAKNLGNQVLQMARAGREYAQTIGVSAVQGVQLDLNNRKAMLAQLGKVDANRMVNMQQIQAAESSLADTFIGVRDGMQLSAEGATRFAQNLKGGFGSEFELTGESLRALTVIGASTEGQMDAFRKATGRASLSSGQLSTIVNKNSMSFLLYGNSFAKAAANAEKMGVNLASIQSAQEGMVSNLDNVIDTVNQLNQLGANVEFGSLVQKLEQEGPDAVLQYLSSTVPGDLFQSTSFRALFSQLGINSEQILRQQQVGSVADNIESQMTEAGKAAGATAKSLLNIDRTADVLMGSFGGLALAAGAASIALLRLGAQGLLNPGVFASVVKGGVTGPITGAFSKIMGATGSAGAASSSAGLAGGMGMSIAGGAAAGVFTGMSTYAQTGDLKRSIITGIASLVASLGASLLIGMIPVIGPLIAPFAGPMVGSFLAKTIVDFFYKKGDDIYSGYGDRTLLTSSGAYALNNSDTVIAGTNLFKGDDVLSFGEGALSVGAGGGGEPAVVEKNTKSKGDKSSGLEQKIDALINAINGASTVINVSGASSQKVKRMSLVSVEETRGGY